MIFGIVLYALVSLMFLWLSYSLSKGKISLIHDYHSRNVKKEDIKDYTKLYSIGALVMAIGCLLSGVFLYFEKPTLVAISTFAGIIIGVLIFNHAQKKYNGAWFS